MSDFELSFLRLNHKLESFGAFVYHLNRRFIDEKVMQQYYFEKFMNGDRSIRRSLLPVNGNFSKYETQSETKILHPEVKIGKEFNVDFVLYPIDQSEFVYIELKFELSKLNTKDAKKKRHRLLKPGKSNGRPSRGFVVVFNDDDPYWPNEIDVVKLEWDAFAKWYVKNSPKLADQLIQKISPGEKRFRHHPPRNWVVYVGTDAEHHFHHGALKKGKWAFKDKKKPLNLMDIERGDNIVFVQCREIKPSRKPISSGEKRADVLTITNHRSKRVGQVINDKEAFFKITRIDIFEIDKGYYLDFSSKTFEEQNWQKNQGFLSTIDRFSKKEYTQFISFDSNAKSENSYKWKRGEAHLYRDDFRYIDPSEREFIDALRVAINNNGHPHTISDTCLHHIRNML